MNNDRPHSDPSPAPNAAKQKSRETAQRRELRLARDHALRLGRDAIEAALCSARRPFDGRLWHMRWPDGPESMFPEYAMCVKHSLVEHADWLRSYAKELHAKGSGAVLSYTITNGRSRDEDVRGITAIYLDADRAGEWHELLAAFKRLDIANVAQRSGGDRLGVPKWHDVVPVVWAAPPTDPDTRRRAKQQYTDAYGFVMMVLGYFAKLTDSLDVAPGNKWASACYPGTRRPDNDRVPEVMHHDGKYCLDLFALLEALGFEQWLDAVRAARPKSKAHAEGEDHGHASAPWRFRALDAAGLVGKTIKAGKIAITCPFADGEDREHGLGRASSTVFYADRDVIFCAHDHCQGRSKRGQREFDERLRVLSPEAGAILDEGLAYHPISVTKAEREARARLEERPVRERLPIDEARARIAAAVDAALISGDRLIVDATVGVGKTEISVEAALRAIARGQRVIYRVSKHACGADVEQRLIAKSKGATPRLWRPQSIVENLELCKQPDKVRLVVADNLPSSTACEPAECSYRNTCTVRPRGRTDWQVAIVCSERAAALLANNPDAILIADEQEPVCRRVPLPTIEEGSLDQLLLDDHDRLRRSENPRAREALELHDRSPYVRAKVARYRALEEAPVQLRSRDEKGRDCVTELTPLTKQMQKRSCWVTATATLDRVGVEAVFPGVKPLSIDVVPKHQPKRTLVAVPRASVTWLAPHARPVWERILPLLRDALRRADQDGDARVLIGTFKAVALALQVGQDNPCRKLIDRWLETPGRKLDVVWFWGTEGLNNWVGFDACFSIGDARPNKDENGRERLLLGLTADVTQDRSDACAASAEEQLGGRLRHLTADAPVKHTHYGKIPPASWTAGGAEVVTMQPGRPAKKKKAEDEVELTELLEELRQAKKERGAGKLAELIGATTRLVNKWVRGEKRPDRSRWALLRAALRARRVGSAPKPPLKEEVRDEAMGDLGADRVEGRNDEAVCVEPPAPGAVPGRAPFTADITRVARHHLRHRHEGQPREATFDELLPIGTGSWRPSYQS